MGDRASQEFRALRLGATLLRPGVREFRAPLKKFALKKYGSYRGWAERLCVDPNPKFLEDLIEKRTRQLEHLCNDPDDGDARSSLLLAAWESVFGADMPLTAAECGWDPSKL